ncbi:hypothetical protein FRC00_014225, partial [Tulasnella sp. 408]
IPVPALAAAPPPKTKSRGRIRVSKKNDTTFSYFSRYLDEEGRVQLTSSISKALEVEYNPSTSSPRTLRIPDVSAILFNVSHKLLKLDQEQIINFDVLGLRWSREDATEISKFVGFVR